MAVKPILDPRLPVPRVAPTTPYERATIGAWVADEPISEAGLYVAEERYWQEYYLYSDLHYEWNNGILEEKPVADYRSVLLYRWFFMLVEAYLLTHPIAKLLNLEVGFRLALPTKTAIRKPDFFIIRDDNPVPIADDDYTYKGIADLCVESLSDSTLAEIQRDTVTKKGEYAGAGVQEYYILDAYGRYTAFYSRQPNGQYAVIQPDANGIICSAVLPGFQFREKDLRRRPNLLKLVDDPVYQGYVLPEYQAEKARAEQERLRAEQERLRAEEAIARAERLAAQLRALGVAEE